jgi:uncharacterized membrane-anchored protein
MKKLLLTCTAALLLAAQTLVAQEIEDANALLVLDSIQKAFKWQTGKIELSDGLATIETPTGFRYLNAEQSEFILSGLWGNPPGRGSLGMLFPANCGPLDPDCFAFNIVFDELGYVKDADADEIDYNDLLKTMQKEAKEAAPERIKAGYEAIEIVGWASAPFYDKDKRVLHWAKEIKFGDGSDGNTLNYDVRVLGRKGVLSLNAIGSVGQVDSVKATIPGVIAGVTFNEGHRYADFDSNVDEVAAWTIGGLVAGKVLAKAGFFALILKFIKPLIFVLIAGGGALWRFIGGRRKREEETGA